MHFTPIATVHSPYKQKFAIPRQPNLVPQAHGEIRFAEHMCDANLVRGLEQFTHLWLVFVFHATQAQQWQATVSPPRLGGRERVGVFASRSMFRPNPVGLSVVKLESVNTGAGTLSLTVSGLDLLDGTPLLDIKPYIPYADALPGAGGGYADASPDAGLAVSFCPQAQQTLSDLAPAYPELEAFISAVLQQDPRPAQHARQGQRREFGMLLYDLNIRWRIDGDSCEVLSIEPDSDHSFPR